MGRRARARARSRGRWPSALATGTSIPARCTAPWHGRRARRPAARRRRRGVGAGRAGATSSRRTAAITIDGHDVTREIRTPEIDKAAASVARLPHVREVLVAPAARPRRRRRRGDGRPRHRHRGVSRRRPEVLYRCLRRGARAPPRVGSGAYRRAGQPRASCRATSSRATSRIRRGSVAPLAQGERCDLHRHHRRCRSRWSSIT